MAGFKRTAEESMEDTIMHDTPRLKKVRLESEDEQSNVNSIRVEPAHSSNGIINTNGMVECSPP